MRGRILGAVLGLSSIALAAASCSSPESLGKGFDVDAGSSGPSFTGADASLTDAGAGEGLTEYCPSSRCPAGWTACPGSLYPCDVNLLTDRNNCGQCGHVCPSGGVGGEKFECIEGKCVMACPGPPRNIDCDGLTDNGCETDSKSDDNCGGCGIKCLDPAKPCVNHASVPACGCPGELLLCNAPGFGRFCVSAQNDDRNCGACGRECNPDGSGAERPPNTYFGCVKGQCDVPKCEQMFLDCDGNPFNGCETFALDDDNCGACGNVCAPGLACKGNRFGIPTCSCPGDQTYCPLFCMGDICLAGHCTDLASDRENCGGCGHACRAPASVSQSASICSSGICQLQCNKGSADCNGNPLDDCEVNTDSDPQNCGACGRACDAVAGQACVRGQCVVEPCDQIPVDGGPR